MTLTSDDLNRIRHLVRDEAKQTVREETRSVIREEVPRIVERALQLLIVRVEQLERKIEALERTSIRRPPQ